MKTCTIEGCEGKHAARGLCHNHYGQAKNRGDFTDLRPKGRMGCAVEGCTNNYYAKGFCRLHYKRWNRSGRTEAIRRVPGGICEVPECEGRSVGIGLCRIHYDFRRRSGYDLRHHPEVFALIHKAEELGLKVVVGRNSKRT